MDTFKRFFTAYVFTPKSHVVLSTKLKCRNHPGLLQKRNQSKNRNYKL